MAIPTIPGTNQVTTQAIGTPVSSGPRIAALQGVKEVISAEAGAIGTAAETIIAYEKKKQKAEQVAAFNQASIMMREATAQYREQIAKNPDYNSYVPQWQKVAQSVARQAMQNPALTGAAKRQMQMAVASWQSQTNIEFQQAADLRGTQYRRTTATLAAEKAYREGNLNAGDAAIDGAVKVGDMWPEDATRIKMTGKNTAELSQIETGIRVAPEQTMKDIEAGHFKNVTAHQLETARVQARAQIARNQSDNLRGMYDDLQSDPMQLTDARLDDAVKQGRITPQGANSLKMARDRKNLKTAREDYNSLWVMVDQHDFRQDKVPEEAAKDFTQAATALPPEMARPLLAHIKSAVEKAKTTATAEEKPVESQMLQLMREDRESMGVFVPSETQSTTTGSLWWKKTTTQQVPFQGGLASLRKALLGTADQPGLKPAEIESLFGKGATADSVLKAEQDAFAKQYMQMREWFKTPQGQKATFEQANEMRRRLEQPVHAVAAATMVERAKQTQDPRMSPDDEQALQWANANSSDPRAMDIYGRIIAKYGHR